MQLFSEAFFAFCFWCFPFDQLDDFIFGCMDSISDRIVVSKGSEIITKMELLFNNTSVAINCRNFEQSMPKIPVIAYTKRIILVAAFIPVNRKVT